MVKTAGKQLPEVLRLIAAKPGTEVQLEFILAGEEEAKLYTLKRGEFAAADDPISQLAFSPDGRWLASANKTGTFRLRDSTSGEEVRTLSAHKGKITALVFSPDSKTLATGGLDRIVRLWEVPGGKAGPTISREESVKTAGTALACSADGKTLAISNGVLVSLWDVPTGKTRSSDFHPHVFSLAFSPNGETLALGAGSMDGTVKLMDTTTREIRGYLRGHTNSVHCLAFSPNGTLLASASGDDTAKLWEVVTGEQRANLRGHTTAVKSVAFSPDGLRLATGGGDHTAIIWDPFKEQDSLRVVCDDIYSLTFTPDSKSLLACGGDFVDPNRNGEAKSWNALTGQRQMVFQEGLGSTANVAFSPDGKTLAFGSSTASASSSEVRLWDLSSRKVRIPLTELPGALSFVAWSPDGKLLAAGTGDPRQPKRPGHVKLLDVETGRVRATLRAHSGAVSWVAFSNDGETLATGSTDQTVKLWDVRTGHERATLKGHTSAISALAFSPDGKILAVGCVDLYRSSLSPRSGDLSSGTHPPTKTPSRSRDTLGESFL